mgnify:CR=1 FL=1
MEGRSRWRGWLLGTSVVTVGLVLLRGWNTDGVDRDRPLTGVEDRPDAADAEERSDLTVAPLSSPDREPVRDPRASPAPALITGSVRERSGAPIASALCQLRPGLPASHFAVPESREDAPVHAEVLTGADGAFRLAAAPGFWRLSVSSTGFATWERDHLVAGEELAVLLDPEVLLFVTVRDPEGQPVADAEVVVRTPGDDSQAALARVRTDPAGRAALSGLAPGAWLLIARRSGYGVREELLEIPPGVFVLEKEIRLERATRLAGTVRSSVGAAIAGARVRIESPVRHAALVEEVLTGADGRYQTAPIFTVRETLEIVASAGGFAESWLFFAVRPEQAWQEEVTLDFVLESSARTVAGSVVDEGQGLPGSSIRSASIDPVGNSPQDVLDALRTAPSLPGLWQEVARTDDSGRFEVAGLSASPQYILLVVCDGYAPRIVWVPPGEAGTRTELGELELDRHGSLFGRATYEDGAPAEGATLTMIEVNEVRGVAYADLGTWRPNSWFGLYRSRTGEGGSFRFDLLDPGSYQFAASSQAWQVEPGQATGPVELVLQRERPSSETVAVSGVVRDRGGQPLSLAFVRAFSADGAPETSLFGSQLVDARGGFALRVPATIAARLHFADLGGTYLEHELFLEPPFAAEPLAVVLEERAEPLPPLEGGVFSPRGEGVEGCSVTLRPPEDSLCGCIAFHARTDPAGEFRFRASEGPHRLTAAHPRYATADHYPARPGEYVVIDLQDP